MWWAAATYRVPFRIREGVGGRLVPWLQYAAGNAWSDDAARPSATHNLGVGLSVGPLAAMTPLRPGMQIVAGPRQKQDRLWTLVLSDGREVSLDHAMADAVTVQLAPDRDDS